MSRTQQKIQNNLGVISGNAVQRVPKFRKELLDKYDAYYECRQYDHLLDWDQAAGSDDEYIAVRKRKPRIIFNLPKVLVDRVSAKLVGKSVYPTFNIEDDPDATDYLRFVQKAAEMQAKILPIIKKMLLQGSSLARFQVIDGDLQLQCYNSKYCYPEMDAKGELISVRIQYVYEDFNDRNSNGDPKKKWFKLELNQQADVLFDNPEYNPEQMPVFTPVETVSHGLGYVQAEWFRTDEADTDGPSIMADIFDMCDELNYGLSQSSQAVSYNHEPLLGLTSLDSDEAEKIVRSATKALNLGRDGKAAFVESNMKGVEAGNTLRDRVKGKIADVVRVVMLDPEKIVGSAQSAKAMEVLHGPLVELIDELRSPVEKCMKRLLLKMSMTLLQLRDQGFETEVVIPDGWQPSSLDVSVTWPPIFPLTIEDLQKKVALATAASNASILSRETTMRWLAKDFGVEDVEEELKKINSQPVLNPFGSF